MNLLKGFGGGGSSMSSMGSMGGPSKPLSNKQNYFSNIKLHDEPQAKEKSKNSERKKGPPKDFIPNKFALSFDPPCIILQYRNPENKKLYHHKMGIKKLKKQTNTRDALEYIKKRHHQYFAPKVIDQGQIEKLIDKLKLGLSNTKSEMEDVQEQDDFDFDYDDDFED